MKNKLKTEERLGLDKTLDQLNAAGIVDVMHAEDARAHEAVGRARDSIARAVELAAEAFARKGRLIYMGAGTSGRLGVLDASECVPTFGVEQERVQGLIAGGREALWRSIENAEDEGERAVDDLASLDPRLNENDMVVGITASGATTYVRAGLDEARRKGARTVLLCCNPQSEELPHHVIALDTGPEVLAGSTRLKAGTATKMALNMISTGAMALSGHIYQGLMIGMKPTNKKLWGRAIRIVATLIESDAERAENLLQAAEGNIGIAVVMAKKKVDTAEATRLFEKHKGSLHALLVSERTHP